MNERNPSDATEDFRKNYPAAHSVNRAPAEDRMRLYTLSLLLTADRAKAEQCTTAGLQMSEEDKAAVRDWKHSWARRVVINNALRLIWPHLESGARK